jgi:hypothetical protein
VVDSHDSTIGGGGMLFGTVHVKSVLPNMPAMFRKDELGFQGFYGSGIGRYSAIGGGLNDAAVVKNPGTTSVSIETQPQVGGVAWYQHWWTDQLRTNVAYGIQHNHWSNAIAFSTSQTDRLQTIHANLIWSPVKAVNIGLEFMYGTRDIRKNPTTGLSQTGDAKRVQFSMQYIF